MTLRFGASERSITLTDGPDGQVSIQLGEGVTIVKNGKANGTPPAAAIIVEGDKIAAVAPTLQVAWDALEPGERKWYQRQLSVRKYQAKVKGDKKAVARLGKLTAIEWWALQTNQ